MSRLQGGSLGARPTRSVSSFLPAPRSARAASAATTARSRPRHTLALTLTLCGALGAALSGCSSPQYGNSCVIPDNASETERAEALARCRGSITDHYWPQGARKEVDILFVIDNSPSMSPKQQALSAQIPNFIRGIESLNVNYHVGIVTTDVGSTTSPSSPWGGSVGSCNTFAGDDGKLQAVPCTDRQDLTAQAKNACAALCPDPRFVPTSSQRFISKIDGVTNVPRSLEPDPKTGQMVDQGPARAFQCMALVGDAGCGIEAPLEAAMRALDGHSTENKDFLRPNSLLAVIFITDEDDCSVQLARRNENAPVMRSCDPTQPDSYDCYNIDFRCLARSSQCDQTLLTPGQKSNCKERPGSYLEPVDKYYKFLSAVRPGEDKLVVSGIWTKPSLLAGGKLVVSGDANSTPSLNRAPGTDASCAYSKDQQVFGQAQHRLSKFASMFGTTTVNGKTEPAVPELSICDIDTYDQALTKIRDAIAVRLQPWCLGAVPKTSATGQPTCLVGDVDEKTPNATPDVLFPSCSATCCSGWAAAQEPTAKDPGIQAACAGETTEACYCAVTSAVGTCASSKNGVVVPPVIGGVWRRGGAEPPVGKVASFRCASQ